MCDFSALELAGIAIALDEEEGERNRKRFWVHPMLVKNEGEYNTLYCCRGVTPGHTIRVLI